MNIPRDNTMGLLAYRELLQRERNSGLVWESHYGRETLLAGPRAADMLNVGKFERLKAMPMPLDLQLKQIYATRAKQILELQSLARQTDLKLAGYAVSEASVNVFGKQAWHTPARAQPFKSPRSP
eukprot:6193874-Pleurochrysis_carterae.AAC.1